MSQRTMGRIMAAGAVAFVVVTIAGTLLVAKLDQAPELREVVLTIFRWVFVALYIAFILSSFLTSQQESEHKAAQLRQQEIRAERKRQARLIATHPRPKPGPRPREGTRRLPALPRPGAGAQAHPARTRRLPPL